MPAVRKRPSRNYMSGICAVWHSDDPVRTSRTLPLALTALCLRGTERCDQELEGNVGIAVAARFASQQFYSDSGILLACDADLINEDHLAQQQQPFPKHASTASHLATLYRRFGADFIARL